MILSFNPIYEGDRQIICAGRDPNERDLAAIRSARAVILPQGCRWSLYRTVKENCPHFFPNYDARFAYSGKCRQVRLFRHFGVPHPPSLVFSDAAAFVKFRNTNKVHILPPYPFVFKFDWGGEGDFVYPIESESQLNSLLDRARRFENTGQSGFLIQAYIPGKPQTLRVVVIYKTVVAYWRTHSSNRFYGNLSKGAEINRISDPDLRQAGIEKVVELCQKTGINLAGFDLMFSMNKKGPRPLFLEINYFFGRQGLGGSEAYYELLTREIHRWIRDLDSSTVHDTKD
ncbi:MAG: hypothetical protein R6U50_10770 [Desulfobacterales bacterium]